MADLEAVLADVSYLMAMEKSKSTPAARASKKIVLPDPRWERHDTFTWYTGLTYVYVSHVETTHIPSTRCQRVVIQFKTLNVANNSFSWHDKVHSALV